MKIAIVLTGVTHGYVEDTCKYDVPRNFYACAPNLQKLLIDPLKLNSNYQTILQIDYQLNQFFEQKKILELKKLLKLKKN